MVRRALSPLVGVVGTMGVVGLSLGMNGAVERRVLEPATVIDTRAVAAKPEASRSDRRERRAPQKRSREAAPTPGPMLAAGLSGLDFGLGDGADEALAGATTALVTRMGGAVMDEGSVEDVPRPTERTPPVFPPRARSLGQSGHVTLSFVVDVDGSVQDVVVVESDPPGVFDPAAVEAVRAWTFEPGRHDGAPVAVRVRQTLRFELE